MDPVEPVDPLDPCGPVGPVGPVGPAEPVEPVEPVDPVEPFEPIDPVDPIGPFGPPPSRYNFFLLNEPIATHKDVPSHSIDPSCIGPNVLSGLTNFIVPSPGFITISLSGITFYYFILVNLVVLVVLVRLVVLVVLVVLVDQQNPLNR